MASRNVEAMEVCGVAGTSSETANKSGEKKKKKISVSVSGFYGRGGKVILQDVSCSEGDSDDNADDGLPVINLRDNVIIENVSGIGDKGREACEEEKESEIIRPRIKKREKKTQ